MGWVDKILTNYRVIEVGWWVHEGLLHYSVPIYMFDIIFKIKHTHIHIVSDS